MMKPPFDDSKWVIFYQVVMQVQGGMLTGNLIFQ
jgi:hypothetical protein